MGTPLDTIIDGKYRIVRQLGEGGMGAVYEARHEGTGRRVALKVIVAEALARGAAAVERFQREAKATGAIETQHIALVLDTGTDAATGNPYLVMEYLQGEDVSELIARTGPLSPDVAMRVVAQACLGIVKAHEAGVIHRDIKPANLYLARRDGGEVVVKVLDFGIAKVREGLLGDGGKRDITKTGALLGSPLYMSPEQARGDKNIDGRSDVWSLGVVLYEALTGKTPHGDIETVGGIIVAICSKPARNIQDLAAWVDPSVAAIVHRALSIEPEGRFQTASELLDALKALLPGGWSLTEAMLVGVSADARGSAAPKADLAFMQTAQARLSERPVPSGRTTGGLSRSGEAPPRPRSMAPWIGAAAVVAVAGAVAAYELVPRAASTPPAPPPSVTSAAAPAVGSVAPASSSVVASAPDAAPSVTPATATSARPTATAATPRTTGPQQPTIGKKFE